MTACNGSQMVERDRCGIADSQEEDRAFRYGHVALREDPARWHIFGPADWLLFGVEIGEA